MDTPAAWPPVPPRKAIAVFAFEISRFSALNANHALSSFPTCFIVTASSSALSMLLAMLLNKDAGNATSPNTTFSILTLSSLASSMPKCPSNWIPVWVCEMCIFLTMGCGADNCAPVPALSIWILSSFTSESLPFERWRWLLVWSTRHSCCWYSHWRWYRWSKPECAHPFGPHWERKNTTTNLWGSDTNFGNMLDLFSWSIDLHVLETHLQAVRFTSIHDYDLWAASEPGVASDIQNEVQRFLDFNGWSVEKRACHSKDHSTVKAQQANVLTGTLGAMSVRPILGPSGNYPLAVTIAKSCGLHLCAPKQVVIIVSPPSSPAINQKFWQYHRKWIWHMDYHSSKQSRPQAGH